MTVDAGHAKRVDPVAPSSAWDPATVRVRAQRVVRGALAGRKGQGRAGSRIERPLWRMRELLGEQEREVAGGDERSK
jgi:hypothetical protein